MQFEIVSRQFKDNSMQGLIVKIFEYFATINTIRAEKIKKSKNREELIKLMSEMVVYVEQGLKKKLSENFFVLVSEQPNYALKYEKNYLLGLKYGIFDILILKSPFICIPMKFVKALKFEEQEEINKFCEEK